LSRVLHVALGLGLGYWFLSS